MIKEIDDLASNPRNPRKISDKAKTGLRKSIQEFGDISGIVFNEQTGQLVSGHQRVAQLMEMGAYYRDGSIWLDKESHPVRVVDWSPEKEAQANVAANNPKIQGDWSDEIGEFLKEIKIGMSPEDFDDLGFLGLADDLRINLDLKEIEPTGGDLADEFLTKEMDKTCPRCGFEFDD